MKLKVFIKNNSPSKTTFFCLLIVHLLSTSCGLVWMSSLFFRKAVKMMKIQLEEQNDSIGRVRLTSGFFTRHPELFPKSFIFFCAAKLGGWVSTEMSSVCAPNGFSALVSTFDRFHVGPSTLVLTLLVWKGNSNVIIALLFNISYWHHTARKDWRVTRHASLQSNVLHLYKTQERYWPTDNCLSVPQYLTQSVSMLITKGSSSLTQVDLLPLFFPFSLYLPFFSASISVFLFFQGPHIASVTLAAYECGSVDFPEPPYPEQIVCPQQEAPASDSGAEQVGVEAVGSETLQGKVSLWTILSKVRLEACMWVSVCYTSGTVSCGHYRWEHFKNLQSLAPFVPFQSQFAATFHISHSS